MMKRASSPEKRGIFLHVVEKSVLKWSVTESFLPLKAMVLRISHTHDFLAQNLSKQVWLTHKSLQVQ